MIYTLLFFLFWQATVTKSEPASPDDAAQFQAAAAQLKQGHPEAAEQILLGLSSRYPDDARINEMLGVVYHMQREPLRASLYLEKAAKQSPSAHIYSQLGANFTDLGREQDAVKAFQSALAIRPSDPEANFSLATLYLKSDRFTAALPLLQRVIQMSPVRPETAYLLAMCYSSLGRQAQARRVLLTLPANQRDREEIQLALGTVALSLGRRTEAQAAFEHAQRLNPTSQPAAANLGALLVAGGQRERGQQMLESAWNRDHTFYLAGYNLALAYEGMRDFSAAREVLNTLLIQGETAELDNLLGEAEAELGDNQSAIKHLEQAVKLEPNETNLFSLGYRQLQLWLLASAEQTLSLGSKKFSNSARIWMALGCAYFAEDKDNEAISAGLHATANSDDPRAYRFLFETYQSLDTDLAEVTARFHRYRLAHPNDAWANFYDGYGFARASRLDRALPLLQRCVQLNPKIVGAQFHLGNVYMRQKRMNEAITAYEAAVKTDPDYVAAYYRLGLAYLRVGRREESQATLARHGELLSKQTAKNDARQQTIQSIYQGGADK